MKLSYISLQSFGISLHFLVRMKSHAKLNVVARIVWNRILAKGCHIYCFFLRISL